MSNKLLESYRNKRDFALTPEPKGLSLGKYSSTKQAFVIQMHAASKLHYDFRLEIDGVLKSWAVPKGPSLNHQDKRLAIQTEDHPLEYQHFEGVIPPGQYGAGIVLIWDKGYFEHLSTGSTLIEDYNNGHLIINLHGKKLKGKFILQRLRKSSSVQWLLIKLKDNHDRMQPPITDKERSVVSGMTLKQIASKSQK
jgi:DNA ligase D-like protein (predicted 3'-phosphoesterase)